MVFVRHLYEPIAEAHTNADIQTVFGSKLDQQYVQHIVTH